MSDLRNLTEKLTATTDRLKRYLPVIFVVMLLAIYGLLTYRTQTLNNAEPTVDATTAQASSAKIPRIDPKVIAQLKSLQDNSVTVKSLFDQARNNPFNE